jgi:hypothetical protein
MDPLSFTMVARAAERLLDVLAGVLAIYFGYRLFALLPPTQTDSNGRFELPGVKIVFARVGPGLLFAGLGVAIVAISLSHPISVEGPSGRVAYSITQRRSSAELAEQMMELSCLGEVAASPSARYPRPVGPTLDSARAALLLANWHAEWGDVEAFRRWIRDPDSGELNANVKALYFMRREKCFQ